MENMDVDEDEESGLSLLEYLPSSVLVEIFKFLSWSDLRHLSVTCTKFNQICQSASLWLNLHTLDFRCCHISDKILSTIQKTPNAKNIILEDVIVENSGSLEQLDWAESNMDEGGDSDESRRDNLLPADRFILEVIKTCPQLVSLDMYMAAITDTAFDAICAKCMNLEKLGIHDNDNVTSAAICSFVSLSPTLTSLEITSCEQLDFVRLQHRDRTKQLNLTHVCLQNICLTQECLETLLTSCRALVKLDITASDHLMNFAVTSAQGQGNVLSHLEELLLIACKDLEKIILPACPKLRVLDATDCVMLQSLTATCPLLQQLTLDGCNYDMQELVLSSCDLEKLSCAGMSQLNNLHIGSSSLKLLNLQGCARLSAGDIVAALADVTTITDLNISGCKGIPPTDVNSLLLAQFSNLEKLTYGGHAWNSVQLTSERLKQLHFTECLNTPYLAVDMPSLTQLVLKNCRDFSEQELFDFLLYGKQISRLQGLETLVVEQQQPIPFSDNAGIPDLRDLKCHKLPGLHGDYVSNSLQHFIHLTNVEFVSCISLVHLNIDGWPAVSRVKIESCSHLNKLHVSNVPTLQYLHVMWCSMVDSCRIEGENLVHLDRTGTSFAHLTITCDNLTKLDLNGVCTVEEPRNTLCLRCRNLQELSITKCDRLSDAVMKNVFNNCPSLTCITVIGSLSLRNLCLPSKVSVCSLTGHRLLHHIQLQSSISVNHLTLNNLPKLVPSERLRLLAECESSLHTLEVRAIPGETTLRISLQGLHSLTLDQGIHLSSLEICCPKLKYLRIQGCPRLSTLSLGVEKLSQIQVYHSTPLRNLSSLTLHCTQVLHLARVLAYYCPKIEELCIHGSEIKEAEFSRLCQNLAKLHTVKLYKCNVTDHTNKPVTHGNMCRGDSRTDFQHDDGHRLSIQYLS